MEFRYCIDPTVALFKVIEITVNCVLARNGVIEVAILDHHLRLHETGLGPLQHGKIVARSVIANTDSPLVSPVGDVGQHTIHAHSEYRASSPLPQTFDRQTLGHWNLLSLGRELRVLGKTIYADGNKNWEGF